MFLSGAFAYCADAPESNASKRQQRVLLLFSFSSSYAEHCTAGERISNWLGGEGNTCLLSQAEFDLLNSTPEAAQSKLDPFKSDLQKGEFDVVVCIGREILSLLKKNADSLPENLPVIVYCLGEPDASEYAFHKNTKLVVQEISVGKELDFVFRLFPDTKRIVPLVGWTDAGLALEREVQSILAAKHAGVECLRVENRTTGTLEMIEKITSAGENTVVLFYAWYGNDSIDLMSLSFILSRLCRSGKIPVFAFHDSMFSYPVAGGAVSPSRDAANRLVSLLNRALKGEYASPESEVQTVAAVPYVDSAVFSQFGVARESLSKDAVIMNDHSPFNKNNAKLLTAVAFSVVLILSLIVYIVVWDYYRRRMLGRLGAVFNQIPSRIVVASRSGIAHFIHVGKFGVESGFVRFPVEELPEYGDKHFRYAWGEVFATGETQKFVMDSGNRHRSVEMALFDDTGAFGKDSAFWISHDIEALYHAQHELQIGLDNQQKLNSLFAAALKMISNGKAVDSTNEALSFVVKGVVDYLGASRGNIMRYDYEHSLMVPFGQEYSDSAEPNDSELFQPITLASHEEWLSLLEEHKPAVFDRFDSPDFAKKNGSLAKTVQDRHITSVCRVPIFIDGKLWGHLSVIYMNNKHKMPEQYLQFLQNAAHIVETVLEYRFIHSKFERGEYEKQLIMENLPLPLLLYDRDLNLIHSNSAAQKEVDGFSKSLKSGLCHTLFCKASCPPSDCPVRCLLSDHKPHVKALAYGSKEYMVNAYPILIDGELTNILLAFFDMTSVNENKRKLLSAVQEARDASKAKSLFLASMSHELRTPLNAVLGFCELLQNSSLPRPRQLEYLDSISVAGNTLLDLISNILDTCKLETEQIQLDNGKTDIPLIVSEMTSMFKSIAGKKNLEQPVELPAHMPFIILDRMRLRQVLVNILGNAFKFTDKGFVGISVSCTLQEQGRCRLAIAVRDSGIGIDPDKFKSIFEPFVQQDALRDTHVYKGSGLGLAISERYIQAMGGRIDLESTVGKGSVFTIVFESIPYEFPTDEERSASAAEKTSGEDPLSRNVFGDHKHTGPAPKVDLSGMSALLVDDVPINLKVLNAMVKTFHLETKLAGSGADAVAAMQTAVPDLVLTDMWMPGISGAELAQKIRADHRLDKAVILAVTADIESKNNFDMSVFDGILLKPVTKDTLAFAFQNLIDKGLIKRNPAGQK